MLALIIVPKMEGALVMAIFDDMGRVGIPPSLALELGGGTPPLM